MPLAMLLALLASLPTPKGENGILNCVWIDIASSAPFAFEGATREASAILEGVGVQTAWRRSRPGATFAPDEMLLILMPRTPRGGLPAGTLGAVSRSSSSRRALWLYLPTIAATLGTEPGSVSAQGPRVRSDFARALGRVAAHEIIHLLLPEMDHARSGLMAPTITPSALVGSRPEPGPLVRQLFAEPAEGAIRSETARVPPPDFLAHPPPRV